MAISTDIILGVSRAADEAKRQAAVTRLEEMGVKSNATAQAASAAADADEAWAAEVRRAAASVPQPASVTSAPGISGQKETNAADQKKDVYVKFEALLVQNMIEAMMPNDLESVFGSGTAGKVWKSMLAEQVSMEIARTGTLGIAKQIAGGEAARMAAATDTKADKG